MGERLGFTHVDWEGHGPVPAFVMGDMVSVVLPGDRGRDSRIDIAVRVCEKQADHIESLEARVRELETELAEQWATVLIEHSYEMKGPGGWWYHSCMSDQEEAIAKLVGAGIFERHENGWWYRPIDKDHWFYLNHKEYQAAEAVREQPLGEQLLEGLAEIDESLAKARQSEGGG